MAMTAEQKLIDNYIVEVGDMFARLGHHLVTLDNLRDEHKHVALEQFGLVADPTIYDGNLHRLVASHIDHYDNQMGTYLRYAHVVLTYLVFEDRLHAFGRLRMATHRGNEFVAGNGKGSLIKKFAHYLTVHSIKVPSSDAVESLRLIRNCVVHCHGRVADYSERDTLRQRLPSLVGVVTDGQERLKLTTEGCLNLQEGAIQYVHAINSAAGFRLWIPPAGHRQ